MAAKISPRQAVLDTLPAHHGALDHAEIEELGLDPEDILDFSNNINPFGPATAAAEAIAEIAIERYPDGQAIALRRAVAEQLSLSMEQVVAGNGTAELIWLITLAFVRPGDQVLVLGPTFGEYARCINLAGGRVEMVVGQASDNFTVRPASVEGVLQNLRPRLAFICNPNNPTGTTVDSGLIGRWADDNPGTLFVIDEAYLPFAPGIPSALIWQKDNIVVLRSMTKDHALAGLRLGYAAGAPWLIEAIARVRPAWNVNAMAQAAGLAALQNPAHLQASLKKLLAAKDGLTGELLRLDLAPVPSATHYFIVDVGRGADLRSRLLKDDQIQVRDCASFGLPTYIRIATRRPEENARLVAALAQVLS